MKVIVEIFKQLLFNGDRHPDRNPTFDTYWDLIVYNANLTNSNDIVVEAIRQWLILILSFFLGFLFWASIRILHKAQKQWDLD